MDLFGNELMKAAENEEDVNELNDVTFGNASEIYDDWEWEKDHEPMADVLKSGSKDEPFMHSLDYENDDEELDLDNDLKSKLSQLVIDDDEENDEGIVTKGLSTRKAVDLNELFGPSSPPGLFSADELITGVPNIWGSPVRESRMKDDVGGLKNLLQSLQKNPSYEERYFPTSVQQNSSFLPEGPKVLPTSAKTLEEIEEEMIHGKVAKTCWRVEEVEKALTAEDVERDLKNQLVSDQARNMNHHHHLAGSPGLPPAELHPNVSLPMLRMQPMVNQVVPTMPGVTSMSRSPFPMPVFGRSGPIPMTVIPSPIPGQRPPGVDLHQWNAGSNSLVHHRMMPRHLPPNNLNYLLSRAAAVSGLGLPPNRQILQRPMPGFPHHAVNHLQNLNRNNDHGFPMRPPNFNANHIRPPPSSLNQHYLLQHQQLFQQQQMYHQQQSGYHGGGGPAWPPEDFDRYHAMRRDVEVVDEYAGLMTQREKDWIIKIQLLQLHTDNPYVDDYYFTCWSIKKMLEEKLKKEGIVGKDKTREVTLVLPQMARVETRAYAPVQFEGSLGKLTASSIHNPRQIIDFHLSQSSEHEDGHHLERKRFKESLLVIEKGYDMLLDIDDIEKKALAQPPDARLPLHEQRLNLIQSLYQRLCFSGEEAESGSSVPRTGLSNLISVHKGLLLAIRLLPLLEKADSEAFSCSLLRKLPLVMKKEDWPRFYNAISQVIQTANLESLVRFASEINEESCSKNRLNSIISVIQNKLGVSLVLALVSRGETIYSTQSPLDLDADEQQKWRAFIELVADALENLNKDMLERPLDCLKNVRAHFARFLEKRQMLAIEDKLDVVLASEV